MLKLLQSVLRWINERLSELSGLLVAIIALALVVGFVARTADSPVIGVTELAQFAMVAIIFLGQGLCEQDKSHVRVEALIFRLKGRAWNWANYVSFVINSVGAFLLLWGALLEAHFSYISLEAMSGLILIPLYPVKFIIVIGLALFFAQSVLNLVKQVADPMPNPVE